MSARRGFSLLEVMIALAIFGLVIVGVLGAQASVAATNKKAADVGQSIELARCKMSELEEKLIRDGYQDLDMIETDVICCEGVDTSVFTCETKVEKVTMPDPPTSSAFDGDGGGLNPLGPPPGASGTSATPGMPTDLPMNGQLDLDGGLGAIANTFSPQTGGQGTAGLLNMVMGFVYPSLKPLMEVSIRKITVTVHWNEGPNAQQFAIVQYVTNPQKGGFGLGIGPDGGVAPASSGSPATNPAGAPPVGQPGGAGGSTFQSIPGAGFH